MSGWQAVAKWQVVSRGHIFLVAYCLGRIVSSGVLSLVADNGGGISSRGILSRGILTRAC
jgi:hypothetical protein